MYKIIAGYRISEVRLSVTQVVTTIVGSTPSNSMIKSLKKDKKYSVYSTDYNYNWNFIKTKKIINIDPFYRNSNLHVSLFHNYENESSFHKSNDFAINYKNLNNMAIINFLKNECTLAYMIFITKFSNQKEKWSFFQINNKFYFLINKNKFDDFFDRMNFNSNIYIYYENALEFNFSKRTLVFTSRSNRKYCNNNLIKELYKWNVIEKIKS